MGWLSMSADVKREDYLRRVKMKRITLFIIFVCILSTGIFAQSNRSYYVKASGNDRNSGLSESSPFKTILHALINVGMSNNSISTITVIGTLDNTSEGELAALGYIFRIVSFKEILITGKPNATGSERAVLSGRGVAEPSNVLNPLPILEIMGDKTKIRFEHIEISGGVHRFSAALIIKDSASVTLGTGTVIRNNAGDGVEITVGTCIMDGGEIRDNNRSNGVYVNRNGTFILNNGIIRDNARGVHTRGRFIMSGGTITNNRSTNNGAGVTVSEGNFTMSAGSITNNSSTGRGGGVFVRTGARFDQTGGIINSNTAEEGGSDVFREE
jgi:hypothetical protein